MRSLPIFADPDVLKAVRTCEGLQRLVYVSCNQNVLANDLSKYAVSFTLQRREGWYG